MNRQRSFPLPAALLTCLVGFTLSAASAGADDVQRRLDDAREEGSIGTAIALNPHLGSYGIEVAVSDGRATLTGAVESDVERDLAEQIAMGMAGVRAVNNRLDVDPGLAAAGHERPRLAKRVDDATLAATIRSKLRWNSNTEGLDIQVRTQDGAVTLSGEARTPVAKELAGALAENTEGVGMVYNHLSVSTADSASAETRNALKDAEAGIGDAWITGKVKSSFVSSRNLDSLSIEVTTREGVVNLSGTVLSSAEKRMAIEIARNIRGVRAVDADALRIVG